MKPINKTKKKITYLKVSNMMTNKEVVSVQKLQNDRSLVCKKFKIQKRKKRTLSSAHVYQNRKAGSQSSGSKVAGVRFLFLVD